MTTRDNRKPNAFRFRSLSAEKMRKPDIAEGVENCFIFLASRVDHDHFLRLRFVEGMGSGSIEKYIQFWKMNMDHLLNRPYVNEVTFRGQKPP